MCMTMMILRDLPHTCTCTWCCIQRDSGNKIMALLVLRTRELQNLFKLNFTLTMRLTLAILGRPPGRALFNVKSRTLRVLTLAFLHVMIWESGDSPTHIHLPTFYWGTKQKKGPQDDKGYLVYLFGRLSSRLGFFNEIKHIILFIIMFQEDFQMMTIYL